MKTPSGTVDKLEVKRGAQWRRWDLHVHTPCSINQDYGGDTEEVWEKFILDLESLPADSVIGINDYIFLDGYKKVIAFKKNGRLKNISKILPVVELRLDRFGGTEGKWSRVNLHVIFSDDVEPETIEAQFVNAVSASYRLSPEYATSVKWQGIPTKKSLIDLGDKIKQVTPEDSPIRRQDSLSVGFSNLNVSIDKVREILRGEYFQDKCLTAIGKTEWFDIKWTEASIAEKKSIICSVDMVFTAARTVEDWRKSKAQLEGHGVNSRLLDCSDAHTYSNSTSGNHLKIGTSMTWMKCDPSFEGLRHAVCHEYETRVFIGDRPSQMASVLSNPTKFIKSINFKKIPASPLAEDWFDGEEIHLNPGLIAIIGNKGSGKSALADVLGLLGNCHLDRKHYGFLNKERFLNPSMNKGANFVSEVIWESTQSSEKNLAGDVDRTKMELVKYIPQSYLEELCNHTPENPDGSKLESELKDVILSHIPVEERLGSNSLDDLIDEHTKGNHHELEGLRASIASINREICAVEEHLKPAYKARLTSDLALKTTELSQHDANKPAAIPNPDDSGSTTDAQNSVVARISRWQRLADLNKSLLENASAELTSQQGMMVLAKNSLLTLSQAHDRFSEQVKSVGDDLKKLGISISDVVSLTLDTTKITGKQSEVKSKIDRLQALLNPFEGKYYSRKARVEARLVRLQEKLAGPSKAYQAYLLDLKKWEQARLDIIGSNEKAGTLNYLNAQIEQAEKAPQKLVDLQQQRALIAATIAEKSLLLLSLYQNLYKPVQDFIERKILQNDHYQLSFEARIQCENFVDRFLKFISHGKAGSFYGIEEARTRVQDLVEKTNFQSKEGILEFLENVLRALQLNLRQNPPIPMDVDGQLAKGVKRIDVYNFLFGLDFLTPRFSLKMGDRPLEQLSPGEKGLLLLAFYLLLDKDCRPLVIDQPEENLDNQTVHQLLVPCVKEARTRRQVVLVTHNPNVAVVCDADQVVIASMQKKGRFKVSYESGSIESPKINSKIVDILEGTMRAFRNRDYKYHKAPV